jgi:hypothetical protein
VNGKDAFTRGEVAENPGVPHDLLAALADDLESTYTKRRL